MTLGIDDVDEYILPDVLWELPGRIKLYEAGCEDATFSALFEFNVLPGPTEFVV